ncbi:putative prophage phiRv2 integrase [compost metagenome]
MTDERYAELFPNTSYAATKQVPTFGGYCQVWLDSREVVKGTRDNYRSTLNRHWMPYLAMIPITQVSPLDIRRITNETPWVSPTAKRTALVRLRVVLRSAVNDGYLAKNPGLGVDLPRQSKRLIDPFTQEEADRIIAHLYTQLGGRRVEIYAAYFEFAFYSGLRPGEQRALLWEEIDDTQRTAHICRIIAEGGVVERVKNKKRRKVLLNDRAWHALQRAKAIREKLKVDTEHVFPPAQGKAWMGEDAPNDYLVPAMKALGIRKRRQYDTRHTYATMCLMAGMNLAFIANQLGHTIEVLLSTYAEWINSPSDWSELAKLETRAIGTKLVQDETAADLIRFKTSTYEKAPETSVD